MNIVDVLIFMFLIFSELGLAFIISHLSFSFINCLFIVRTFIYFFSPNMCLCDLTSKRDHVPPLLGRGLVPAPWRPFHMASVSSGRNEVPEVLYYWETSARRT